MGWAHIQEVQSLTAHGSPGNKEFTKVGHPKQGMYWLGSTVDRVPVVACAMLPSAPGFSILVQVVKLSPCC